MKSFWQSHKFIYALIASFFIVGLAGMGLWAGALTDGVMMAAMGALGGIWTSVIVGRAWEGTSASFRETRGRHAEMRHSVNAVNANPPPPETPL